MANRDSLERPVVRAAVAVADAEALAPAQRRAIAFVLACACAVALVLARPAPARAGWPLPSAGCVTCAFGESYTAADGTSATHRGVDIAAAAGTRVVAPLAGHVTFAGRVPGTGGGSVLAATIETAHGTLTLMPLESLGVKRGAQLAEGDDVGTLAGEGDASSAEAHLHVGAKKGDLYVDPLGIITPPAAAAGGEAQAEPNAATQPSRATAAAGAHAAAVAGASAHVAHAGSSAGVTAGSVAVAAGAGARGAASAGAGVRAPVAGAVLAPGVSVAGASQAAAGAPAALVPGVSLAPRAGAVGAASSPQAATSRALDVGALLARGTRFAARSARTGAMGLVGVLAALGALWPLWRREKQEGLGKVSVRPVGDDVAAVAGR